MSEILIVADDLSGAADCGIACAVRGSETLVLLDGANRHPDADVLAVDADTRSMTAAGAAAETARLVRSYARPLPQILYKKFDSTLRGHIGVEIAAALAGWRSLAQPNSAIALAAPAFPAMGRTTVGGRQCVHGAPLEADLRCMLETAGLRTGCIGVDIVRGGGLAAVIRENAFAALACDAETDEDLATIGAVAASFGPGVMWAGSGGLARYLPISARMRPAAAFPSLTRPLLFAVGSAAELSRMQAATLAAIGEISTVILTPGMLLAGPGTGEWIEHTALVSAALADGHDVLVLLSPKIPGADIEGPSLCAALASFLAPLRTAVGALVLTGGETARAVLTAFRVRTLRLLREVEPGVPLALGLAEGSEPLPVITKAGAFGGRETLVRCRAALWNGKGDHGSAESSDHDGDAAGVGAEIIMKGLAHREVYEWCRPLVIGDAARLRTAGKIAGIHMAVRSISPEGIEEACYTAGTADCIDLAVIPPDLPWGRISPIAGDGAFRFIKAATELAMAGKVDAICTAPLNKEALQAGGHRYPGHTELLAELTGTPEVSMMLTAPNLRVIHVTTHIGLLDAIGRIEPGLVERTIARGREVLVRAGLPRQKIGVCGINPHAGEHGLFGHGEEEPKIVPAVNVCRANGWDVEGPLPADTLFFRAARGDFDMVVAMYHDQGHGPVKVLGLEAGVNITVGLPVIRTSVDHGTAFDIAGTGKADERSLLEALKQAVELAPRSR